MNKILQILLPGILLIITCCSPSNNSSPNLDRAREVAAWLSNQKDITGSFDIWVDEIGSDNVTLSLSSGVAGKVLFFLDLYKASEDKRYLDEALAGCDYIKNHLPSSIEESLAIRNSSSLYGDIPGSLFVLVEAQKLLGENQWSESIEQGLNLLDSMSQNDDGRYWNQFNDILVGSAGTGLFLLYLHRETGNDRPLEMAIEAAEVLVERVVSNNDSLYWYLNQDSNFNLPNFSHGAAGTGYFFVSLYEITGDNRYMDMALKAARYLDLIAWKPNNSFLLPYGFPDIGWEREYDIGWAHGPAGTARFFHKLWQVTGDQKWRDVVMACSKGIQYSGLPGPPRDKFGTTPFPMDMRFGSGGVIEFQMNLLKNDYLEDSDPYLRHLMDSLDSRAIIADGSRYWEIERYGFMGGEKGSLVTFTGYFYGAAGLGRLYTLKYYLETEQDWIRLPDDPF